jgi:hypothetical protein
VESKFQDILNSVTVKPGRSRLEPYGESIDELHRRGLTYCDIAAILAQKCEFHISKSAINDFVRAQSRRRRSSAKRIAIDAMIAAPWFPKSRLRLLPRNPARTRPDRELRHSKHASP